jgi:hypothetical protein
MVTGRNRLGVAFGSHKAYFEHFMSAAPLKATTKTREFASP